MPINLSKGQKVDLTKGNPGLKNIMVGLGWDVNAFDTGADFDLDAAAFMCGSNGKCPTEKEFIFYGNLEHPTGCVKHMGDNLTGAGEGDDEQIFVDLQNVPLEVGTIVFAVNIYDAFKRNQHFGMIRNAFIRLVDMDTGTEICRFNLSENYEHNVELCRFELSENYYNMTALVAGALMRTDNGWEFITDGNAARVESLVNVVAAFAD